MQLPSPSPMARFQARLDHLFQTFRAPDGGEFTYRQVATGIEQLVGYRTSPSYLQVLRTGIRINPSIKHLHGLCAFFGVPNEYFFDEDLARQLDAQLELAAPLRDPAVRELATRAVGLSVEAVETLTRMVEHVRHLEGLDTRPASTSAANGARPSVYPRRRGRRARARGGETPSDGSSTNGAS
jgi:transcriptional regulator with XRE-family HTH domain